jgi:hypothetical protein
MSLVDLFRIMSVGGDWGSYLFWNEDIQFDYETLVAAGMTFMSFRSDQEQIDHENGNYSTVRNIQAARKRGVAVVGVYSWLYPHLPQKSILPRYIRAIEREKPDFIEVDAEQVGYYGEDGLLYIPSQQQTADALLELSDGLITAFPELPFLLYTRPDWVIRFANPALPYIDKYDQHSAAWPDYGLEMYDLPLEEIMAGKMRQVINYNIKPLPWQYIFVQDAYVPAKITPKSRVVMCQTSSRIRPIYKGKSVQACHQYDWNVFLGDKAALLKWAKKTVAPPPVLVEQPYKTYLPHISK